MREQAAGCTPAIVPSIFAFQEKQKKSKTTI
jgi:hypothetical protein